MNESEIFEQIEQLKVEYKDVKSVLETLSKDLNNTAHLRGALSGAGAAAELILKCVYRRERKVDDKIPSERAYEIKKQESEKLMLDELIRNVESHLPLRISTHLRTIQAWRNIGSHNKGHVSETINETTLQVVSLALNELVTWFVGEYLNHDLDLFTSFKESSNSEYQKKSAGFINQIPIKPENNPHSKTMLWKIWKNSENGNLYGFINNEGKTVVFPMYEEIDFKDESRETVCVKINDKWGSINSDGNWIIQPMFDYSFKFNDGVASVCLNSKYGIIDKNANWIVLPIFDEIGDFKDNFAYAFLHEKCGFINKFGNWIIQPIFDNFEVKLFQEGLAGVQYNDKWGYIDNSGNWIINPIFDEIEGFSEGLAFVEIDQKWGVIDKNGAWIIEPIFEGDNSFESYFRNGRAIVKYNGLFGIIDKLGNWIKSPFSGWIHYYDDFNIFACNGLSQFGIGEKWGVIDLNGNWIINPIYDHLSHSNNDLIIAGIEYKYGFINLKNNWIIQPIFENVKSFYNGLALVSLNGKCGYIDINGNWVFQPTLENEDLDEDDKILDLELNEFEYDASESNDDNTFEESFAETINPETNKINTNILLSISFEGIKMIDVISKFTDVNVEIFIDELFIGNGSLQDGFNIQTSICNEYPNINVKWKFNWVFNKSQTITIPKLSMGEQYNIILDFDRLITSNFKKNPKKIIKIK